MSLKDEEQIYLNELKSMKETVEPLLKSEKKECHKNVLQEVGDYFDLIYAYHDVQMLPDLCASQENQDVVNCFIKHNQLFYLYQDIFRYEPYVIAYLTKYLRPCGGITSCFNKMFSHLENYVTFLNKMTSNNQINEAVGNVKIALEKHVPHSNIRFVIAELIVSEEAYIKELETLINDVYPLIHNTKYRLNIKQITGNSEQIYENQKLFYEDLLGCVYDLDITDVMNCFLKHKQHFLLYSEDIALKSNSNLINSFKKDSLAHLATTIDLTVTNMRLMYYKNSLGNAKKKCEGKEVVKIEKVQEMLEEILTTAEDSIQDIVEANIYIETLGSLKTTGFFTIKPELTSEYTGKVYLYEKALVLTRGVTQQLFNTQTVNSYEGHIISTKLGYQYQEKQKILQVYFQDKLVRKYRYNLMSDNEENLLQMKNAIHEILLAQVAEARKKQRTL